jgi:hypothetical protein
MAHVRAVSRDLLGALATLGRYPFPPEGTWSGCDDVGGKALYQVRARLEPEAGRDHALVDAVRAGLGEVGVVLREVPAGTDDPVTLAGRRDGVHVQVTGYSTRPDVLVDLTGPCLDVGDLDTELLSRLAEDVNLG